MTPRISIIVPTRNRSGLLSRLLDSLAHLTYPDWEAIVVDDGGSDDTAAVVDRAAGRGLPITYVWQPWGRMGTARNRGIALASGEILAFTDDDCTVDPNWLHAIADAFDTHPEALGVQGKTVTDRATMTPFTRQVEQLERGQPYRTCNIAYRTDVIRELGGFDPLLIRGEDVVMGMRVLERGPIVFAPDAIVCHPPRPKEWADRRAWRTLLESEVHFKRTYPHYAPGRSATLSVQKPEHVLSRWVLLPIRRYWRWHWAYFRREPGTYLRQVPKIAGEKLALFSLLPYFVREWARPSPAIRSSPPMHLSPPGPFISIVIPTHNRASFLTRLLAALDRQDYPSYEVIVVDDATADGTAAILHGWEREGRRAIRLAQSGGSYAARNAGWRAARGKIIAFTDDDCLPSPGWLSGLAGAFSSGDWAAVQGVTLAEPGESTPFTHEIEQTRPGPPYRTCNIAYRREVLERQGGFDDRLRWYADNLLGLRIGRERIGFAEDAIVFHPPRPREWWTREGWLERFRADALYREELLKLGNLSRAVPPRALPVILWMVRPLVKQSFRHLAYLLRHPWRYAREARPMVREKVALLRALAAYERSPSRDPGDSVALSPLPPDPLASVVIVTRADQAGEAWRAEMLEGALAALEQQTWPRREVIVVAHGHGPAVEAIASRYEVRFVVGDGTLAQARQSGVEAARGEIVAFTDDDCLPSPDWLERAVETLRGNDDLWGVQGRTVAEPGPPGTHAIRVESPDHLYQTCNMAYRRDALCRAGGFDPAFDGWFEDTALGARVGAQGEIGWNPRMVVTHRAVPRRQFDRATWCRVLADERRLAERYPAFYRRVRGPSFLAAVLGRWLTGSALKTLWRALPGAVEHPQPYLVLVRDVLRERGALLLALLHPLDSQHTKA